MLSFLPSQAGSTSWVCLRLSEVTGDPNFVVHFPPSVLTMESSMSYPHCITPRITVLPKLGSSRSRIFFASATNMDLIMRQYSTNGGMSLARMVSVPPSSFSADANTHPCLYSPFKFSLSIFTTRQFLKTNFMPHQRDSTISIKSKCHS